MQNLTKCYIKERKNTVTLHNANAFVNTSIKFKRFYSLYLLTNEKKINYGQYRCWK